MYDINVVTACLYGLIGFRADQNTDLAKIDTDLRVSRSGLYFEDVHPLIELQVLQAIATEEDVLTSYPAWDNATVYNKGAVVVEGSKLYRAITAVPAGTLVSDATKWSETSTFGVWLRNKVQGSIKNLLSRMVQEKKLGQVVKTVLEDAYLFNGAANVSDKEVKQGRFVGYQFVFKSQQGLTALISSITTQLSAAQPTPLSLYLYHTSQADPVKIFEITPSKVYSAQTHALENCLLSYGAESVGGAWFLGYYEDDLAGQALNMTGFNFQSGGCLSCNSTLYQSWSRWYQYVSVLPISVMPASLNLDRTIWDWQQNQYYNQGKTFGLNLHMSVRCDVSPVICSQQILFQQALALQFAVDAIKAIAFSNRINRVQEVTQKKAMYELNNKENHTKGLLAQLDDAVKALSFDFSDFSSACLPCNQATGITYASF